MLCLHTSVDTTDLNVIRENHTRNKAKDYVKLELEPSAFQIIIPSFQSNALTTAGINPEETALLFLCFKFAFAQLTLNTSKVMLGFH